MSASSTALVRSFETGGLDPAAFKHADHVAVAYEMLGAYEFLEACSKYASNLRALAKRAGAPMKFNATITLAFMSLIAERMASREYENYEEFISHNADLRSKNVLEQWYSPERLNSDAARAVFLMPDAR
ncbi:MAG: hypothetical protein GY948_11970 [Alphaproteobacteria bacterium]|nr:hypothetical protein [Alphaproteobacteria bacterium]